MDELTGPLEEVFGDLKRKWREMQAEPPFWDVLQGFLHAVDWTEPWILTLLGFHVAILLAALLMRKNSFLQGCIFALAAGVVFVAEQLNSLASKHWERFSRQHYFDPRGVFFCSVVCGPLVLAMFIVLINYLIACSNLLIQAKRKELIYKAKQKEKRQKEKSN